jgi:hypothetical protein
MGKSDTDESLVKRCTEGGHLILPDEGYAFSFTTDAEGNQVGETRYTCLSHKRAQTWDEYEKTGSLTMRTILDAQQAQFGRKRALGLDIEAPYREGTVLFLFDRVMLEKERVDEALKRWERAVWFDGTEPHKNPDVTDPDPDFPDHPAFFRYKRDAKGRLRRDLMTGLQKIVATGPGGRRSVMVGDMTYITFSSAGRSAFQAEADDGTYVQVILDEDSPSPRGGLNGIGCTADRAIELFDRAIADWKAGKIVLGGAS